MQVSRLGMPLVNEVVIGLKDKDMFNASEPKDDGQFADYVTNPTLPALLEILFGCGRRQGADQLPAHRPRRRVPHRHPGREPAAGRPAARDAAPQHRDRADAAAQQNRLGVLGGDNAGFPNGRRPGDDVVDIELRVAMGVLCHAFPGVFCNPADAPSGTLPYTDGVLQDASQFDSVFPYLQAAAPGLAERRRTESATLP